VSTCLLTYILMQKIRTATSSNGTSLKVIEPGLYSVEVAYKTTCGRSVESKEIRIMVLGGKVTADATSRTVCEGKSTELFTAEAPGLKYIWNKDGVDLSGQNGPRISVSVGGFYRVKVEDVSLGCPASESDAIEITALPPPDVAVSAIPNTSVLCEGEVLTLSAGAVSGYIYQWQKNGNAIPGAPNNVYTLTQNGRYSVAVTDVNGCRNVSNPFSAEFKKQIAVMLDPIPELCEGSSAAISLNGYPAGGVYSGTGVSGNTFNAGIAGKGNHEITYTISDGLSCAKGTARQTVLVDAPPLPLLPARIGTVKGQPVELKADVGSQYIYDWSPPEGLSATDIPNPQAGPESTTIYTVTVTDPGGCDVVPFWFTLLRIS
jgi:hypothetical protein